MAARRSLGGGRVLGTGKNLAPPGSSTPTKAPLRSPALLSPSESSLSLSSQASTTPLSTDHEDILSKVALDEHGSAQAAAAASSRMVCPICNEEMMTLLQLNRHIDDNHANLEEVEQEEVKTWFEQQVKKAKKFQPIQLLNQKLRGLETFESNNDTASPRPSPAPAHESRDTSPSRVHAASVAPVAHAIPSPEPDDIITRAHWQRLTGHDACADPLCGKRLGPANGQINCRHCGKLFCEEHSMYQMKLSRSAQHEPVRGLWYRVCETCYKTREGYNDHKGSERSHMTFFEAVRRRHVDKQYLETSRLETRLTRLTQLLADPPPPDASSRNLWASMLGDKSHLRALEQAIVPWADDASVAECPFCQQPFSQYGLRRHHCRTCGRVVCGDPETGCSREVGLTVAKLTDSLSEKGQSQVALDIRMCKNCQHTIFSKADFAREISTQTADLRAYQNLRRFEQGIRLLLPRFQRLLVALQDPQNPPTPQQLADASKVRKRLTDAFTQYDFAARRIRDLPTENPTQARLQKAVHQQAMSFLHIHMLPLKSLPKILRHAKPNAKHSPLAPNEKSHGASAAINYSQLTKEDSSRPSSSRQSSRDSAALTALEAEEKELRERLIVLEEQKFFVSEMIQDANKRRKFDEVGSLAGNVEDLSREIDQTQAQLAQMDFAGAYAKDNMTIE